MNYSCNKMKTDGLPKICMHVFVHKSTSLEDLSLCVFLLSHSDAAHSVGLAYASDRTVAESCT
jgi:hypothetical protein